MFSCKILNRYKEPMGVDIEITFGENDEVISTDFGAELHTEGSPNARAFFNMVNKGVPVLSFLPSALDLENVISLKSAQISTVWWRNLQNFELANKFTMNEHWPETGHKSTNLEPHIKVSHQVEYLMRSISRPYKLTA